MANKTFAEWLLSELDERGLSYSEAARRGGISHARISQVISGGNPGPEFCLGVADALNLPALTVFQKAGLLPSESKTSSKGREALHLFEKLSLAQQELVLTQIRALVERKQREEQPEQTTAATSG